MSADQKYLEEKAKEEGVVTLPSGLLYKVLKSGPDGAPSPEVNTPCECHYQGTLITGKEFDSSYSRGKPSTFAPNQVIKGWTEAMQLMKEGDKWELYIKSDMAYGNNPKGAIIYAGATLVFTLEMIKCKFPPTLKELFASATLMDGSSEVNAMEALAGKNVALYFSAHWCPPCRGFTPTLVNLYKSMKAQVAAGSREDNFEFVFVSSDRDQGAFDEYFGEMPWLALKFSDREAKSALSDLFEVRGIPSLITIGDVEAGDIVNKSARGSASKDPEGKNFPWYPEPLADINEGPDGLNSEKCIVAMLGGVDEAKKASVMADLKAVAEKYAADAKASKKKKPYLFFFETEQGQISSQVRGLTKAGDGAIVVLDIPGGGKYYNGAAEHLGNTQQLIDDLEGGKLEAQQMSR